MLKEENGIKEDKENNSKHSRTGTTSDNFLTRGTDNENANVLAVLLKETDAKDNQVEDLKSEIHRIPYNTKRELIRSSFRIICEIGSGKFGVIHKGEVSGLYYNESKATVAIKSVHGFGPQDDIDNLLLEVKLMSYIHPHLNLVSMIGSCSSELTTNGILWLLIEFCEYGDLKSYLRRNKEAILSVTERGSINIRSLIIWAYHVAEGMKYLSENKIMHGDLAARNVLLTSCGSINDFPLAKISDFALSKKFYQDSRYLKQNRTDVRWKWMALEFLRYDYFTLNSDLWSYGILLWELFSFGKTPYGNSEYEEVLENLENGYRLPFPQGVDKDEWSIHLNLYDAVSYICFQKNPEDRSTFKTLTKLIEEFLHSSEKIDYRKSVEKYQNEVAINYQGMKSSKVVV